MSDFSCKCREYLKLTGETVYQLAASSGLDRTSLQRMITGVCQALILSVSSAIRFGSIPRNDRSLWSSIRLKK